MRRRVHGPAIVIGDGPSVLPSIMTIVPAGVVFTSSLHGPSPTSGVDGSLIAATSSPSVSSSTGLTSSAGFGGSGFGSSFTTGSVLFAGTGFGGGGCDGLSPAFD